MSKLFLRFIQDKAGATAIEYGLIVAVLSLAIVVGIGSVGNGIEYMFSNTDSRLVQSMK